MNVTVIGTGYVGLVVGPCLADLGNDVVCLDIDKDRIKKLKNGIVPIYEPGLDKLIERNYKENRLKFTNNSKEAIEFGKGVFIAVGTPSTDDGSVDMSYVYEVAENIGRYINEYKVIINKSTVPVGTADKVKEIIQTNLKEAKEFDVVSNPEFLREGNAVRDFTTPSRIIVGAETEEAKEVMEKLYKGIVRTDRPLIFTDVKSAEMIKYASNAMLATRISFMNEFARLCEKVGADIKSVAKGMGFDYRIGSRFLQAGIGYGGSCFPKDVRGIIQTAKENNLEFKVLKAVDEVNEDQKRYIIPKVKDMVGDVNGKKIAVWGLAFKPRTDDMREASSVVIINGLQKQGAKINAFDPEAEESAKSVLKDVSYFSNPYYTLEDCSALVIATEWDEFRELDKEKIKSLLKEPNVIDGRNIYEPNEMKQLGFNYFGIGRKC